MEVKAQICLCGVDSRGTNHKIPFQDCRISYYIVADHDCTTPLHCG